MKVSKSKKCSKWIDDTTINPVSGKKVPQFKNIYRGYSKECDKFLDCDTLFGLKNIDASCYIDSVIMAIFARQNDFIDKKILYKKTTKETSRQFQAELQNIVASIRYNKNIDYCLNIRAFFENIADYEHFASDEQQDAGEFLQAIFGVFNVNAASRQTQTYFTNDLSPNPKDMILSTVRSKKIGDVVLHVGWDIVRALYKPNKTYSIRRFLTQKNDSGELSEDNLYYKNKIAYRRRIQVEKYTNSPYLIFWIDRINPIDETFIKTKIKPLQSISLDGVKRLHLSAIVVHSGGGINAGHYTAYILCNSLWYHYDDTDIVNTISYVGTHQQLLERNKVWSSGMLYIYT